MHATRDIEGISIVTYSTFDIIQSLCHCYESWIDINISIIEDAHPWHLIEDCLHPILTILKEYRVHIVACE